MTLTISFGAHLLPLAVSIAAFTWAALVSDHGPATGYGSIGRGLGNALIAGVAIIVSLVAWLIWAVLT